MTAEAVDVLDEGRVHRHAPPITHLLRLRHARTAEPETRNARVVHAEIAE